MQAIDPAYDGTRVAYSAHQHVKFLPVQYTDQDLARRYTDPATSDCEGGGFFGPLPLLNPSADQYHIEDKLSSATPEHNHDSYERIEQLFSYPNGKRPPYSADMESLQSTLKVARRPSVQRHTDASVSDPAGGAESETTEMPAGSPVVSDVGLQTPKKRKPAATLDKTREVKRTRHRRSQRLDPRGQSQVGIVQFRRTQKWLITALF